MTKSRFILINMLTFLMIISLTVGCIENNETNNKQEVEQSALLTVIFGDYQVNYTLKNLETLEAYTGKGAYIKTKLLPDSIVTDNIHEYTGVRITTLLEKIPNLPDNYKVSAVSSDGLITNYTMNETLGYVDVYYETGNIIPFETAVMILAYKEDGSYYSEIDPENETGPLRFAFVGDSPLYTPSSLWSKMVVSIKLISLQ
jgi:hypothetical protein